MPLKRVTSMLVLGALLVGQALPVRAAHKLCPMATPRVKTTCNVCDPGAPQSQAVLTAGSCCRIAPAEDTQSAPFVVSDARRGVAQGSSDASLSTPAVLASSVIPSVRAAERAAPPERFSPPPSDSRTTVLRN
jgi:hypothetical protein